MLKRVEIDSIIKFKVSKAHDQMVSEGPVLWMGNIRSKGSLKSSGHWSGCEVLGVLSCDWKSEKVQGKMR